MGALPPLETPTRKGGTLPLHGAHTAFSCYPALRLYRLSKSQRGIDVVSLTLRNSGLPVGHGLAGDQDPLRCLLLGEAGLGPGLPEFFANLHGIASFSPPGYHGRGDLSAKRL